MIDPLDLIPVWGTVGTLKGYVSGFKARSTPLVTRQDLEYLESLIVRLEKQLSEAQRIDEEDDNPGAGGSGASGTGGTGANGKEGS